MGLLLKFNLAFGAVFLAGMGATAYVSWNLLQRNARAEIAQDARLLMESAIAQRNYTVSQVKPLLNTQMRYGFLPQTVPAYSATEVFADLRKRFPEFSYKEATLNPTNPRDRAVEWESDIVELFRNDSTKTEISGERVTSTGASFYVARPIRIRDPACLTCHSSVEAAPATLVERYGPANGFGWRLNDVVGAQVISVPTEVPIGRANEAFRAFMTAVVAVFVAIGAVLNLMLWQIVIRPVSKLSALANRVSTGDLQAPEFAYASRDEIGDLAGSFARMRKSVDHAMKLLDA
jgi:HAMP domain-containing protein